MTETENKEMKTETGEEKTEKKLVPRSGPAKKLKGAKRSDKSKNEDKIHAYRIGFHENDLVALLH